MEDYRQQQKEVRHLADLTMMTVSASLQFTLPFFSKKHQNSSAFFEKNQLFRIDKARNDFQVDNSREGQDKGKSPGI
jgi:hypothetical protein